MEKKEKERSKKNNKEKKNEILNRKGKKFVTPFPFLKFQEEEKGKRVSFEGKKAKKFLQKSFLFEAKRKKNEILNKKGKKRRKMCHFPFLLKRNYKVLSYSLYQSSMGFRLKTKKKKTTQQVYYMYICHAFLYNMDRVISLLLSSICSLPITSHQNFRFIFAFYAWIEMGSKNRKTK